MSGRRYGRSNIENEKTKYRGPRKLGDVIADVIVRRGYARQLSTSAYTTAWEASTDEVLSSQSRPGNLRQGVLEVTVRNSTIMQELTFQKKKILKKLNQHITDQAIVDLRLRIGLID